MKKAIISFYGAAMLAVLTPSVATAQNDDQGDEKSDLETAKEIAELEKTIEELRKARIETEAAAAAAAFGPLSNVTREGSVTAEDSGELEAQVLAADALRTIAARIVGRLPGLRREQKSECEAAKESWDAAPIVAECPTVFVMTEAGKQNFESYASYETQIQTITVQLDDAISAFNDPTPSTGDDTSVAALGGLTGISTALSVIGNLGRSEYTFKSIDLEGITHSLLAKAIVENGLQPGGSPYNFQLAQMSVIPSGATSPARLLLDGAAAKRDSLAREVSKIRSDKDKAALVAKVDAAIKVFDDFRKQLSTPGTDGVVPFVAIERQSYIERRLKGDGNIILFVKVDFSGGTTYTKKNFFTFFGGIPFFVSGGALASYTVVDGTTGDTLGAGVIDEVTPFSSVNRIRGRR